MQIQIFFFSASIWHFLLHLEYYAVFLYKPQSVSPDIRNILAMSSQCKQVNDSSDKDTLPDW